MGKFNEYVKEKYLLSAVVASSAAGVISGGVLAATAGGMAGLAGIGVGVLTLAGSVLFRHRTDDEIQQLLKTPAPAVELAGGDKAPDASTQKGAGRYLVELMDKVLGSKTVLGQEVLDSVSPIFENLYEIMKKWSKLEGMAEVQYTVEAILYDYLPHSLEGYMNLSPEVRKENDTKLKAELIEQMRILSLETSRIREGLHRQEMKTITTQSNFLKDRFNNNDSGTLALKS